MKNTFLLNLKNVKICLTATVFLLAAGFVFLEKEPVRGQEAIDCSTEIHIGEVMDDAVEYGYDLLKEYQTLYDNSVSAKDSGFSAANDALSLINNIDGMITEAATKVNALTQLTDITLGNCRNCGGTPCSKGTCSCPKSWHPSVSEFSIGLYDYCELTGGCFVPLVCGPFGCTCPNDEYRCRKCINPCTCSPCTGAPCNMALIDSTLTTAPTSITNYFFDANNDYNGIVSEYSKISTIGTGYNSIISSSLLNVVALTGSATPVDISAELDEARKELRKCVTPYTCLKQALAGGVHCMIEGKIFVPLGLYTCPFIESLGVSKLRCDEEEADSNKAYNFFCCKKHF